MDVDIQSLDILLIHNEILYENVRNNSIETDLVLDAKVDKTYIIDAYNTTRTDDKLDLKLNIADQIDAYTKTEIDTKLDLKANVADIVDSYTKTEDGALLLLIADKTQLIDAYTKPEVDALLLMKADKTELSIYVDLTSDQTIYVQKQFKKISVSCISKSSKSDASIQLAGGCDMLTSELIIQPQLYEIRDITTKKSKACVFDAQSDLNYWMDFQVNVAKLVIGTAYIITSKKTFNNSCRFVSSIDEMPTTPIISQSEILLNNFFGLCSSTSGLAGSVKTFCMIQNHDSSLFNPSLVLGRS
ncbi:MAG: hypothetical protein EZS28_027194 [Streblomastix strix]|uniref:Uncharacterized protein n=1 Tax=Streblomastix strix TaxID=222440 RepID=A0A5J4V3E4_9EUKA|nr:MAG: hypothetical protein EZS28_027194 [Streblomastix strix]